MKRIIYGFMLVFFCCNGYTANIPNNTAFKAMKDEMERSSKKLSIENSPRPFFFSYLLNIGHVSQIGANFGEKIIFDTYYPSANYVVSLNVGTPSEDSWGYKSDQKNSGLPHLAKGYNDSYIDIRKNFWLLSDIAYKDEITNRSNKLVYRKENNIKRLYPDFSFVAPGYYVEDIPQFYPLEDKKLEKVVEEISLLGKNIQFIEECEVTLRKQRDDIYELTNQGGIQQYSTSLNKGIIHLLFRLPNGREYDLDKMFLLKDFSQEEMQRLKKELEKAISFIKEMQNSKKVEPYIGPLLMEKREAADFFKISIGDAMSNISPILGDEENVGVLANRKGLKVMANVADVYSKPQQRYFNEFPRLTFRPIDSEGIFSDDILLIRKGKVVDYPRSLHSSSTGEKSNGHGFSKRERANAIVIAPYEQFSQEELEKKLIDLCKKEDLSYGYILSDYSSVDGDEFLWKIYVEDGHKELVYGGKISMPSLYDIVAFGNEFTESANLLTPAVLFSRAEIMPNEIQRNKKPLIEKP